MMMCRISNITSMNIIIEDIGVRLSPNNGAGSCVIVRADIAEKSVDIKRCLKWIRIETFEVIHSGGYRCPPPQIAPAQPVLVVQPVQPIQSTQDIQTQNCDGLSKLHKSIGDMIAKQEELIRLVSESRMTRRESNNVTENRHSDIDTQVILPGKLIPESVEVSMVVSEDDIEHNDFDRAKEALRRATSK